MSPHRSQALVGRHTELGLLQAHFDLARRGSGRLVLLSGEAGVGKTHLLRTFMAMVRAAGAEVLEGISYEDQSAPPYSPFVQAVRGLLRQRGNHALPPDLAKLAAEIAPLLPELGLPSLPVLEDAEGRKWRIFEAFSRLLTRGDTGPRVLVLEDLHWADRTCHELVAHLAREVGQEQTLIVASYRMDAPDRSLALDGLLERLNRERRREEVRLLPLSPEELSFMAEGLLQRVLPSRLVEGLHGRSGGNPFYAEELLYALKDRGGFELLVRAAQQGRAPDWGTLPETLRDSVMTRAAGLDHDQRETLAYAAVIGRQFGFELLLTLTGLSEPELIRCVEALVRRGLIFEEAEDRYSFRHALTREAVYESLLGRDRRVRHRRVLRALEALKPSEQEYLLEALANHSLRAHEPEAARYARLAGERASQVFAHREAVTFYETALSLSTDLSTRERAELLDALARAAWHLGDRDISESAWSEAHELFAQLNEPGKVSEILRYRSVTAFYYGDHQQAFALLRAALAALKEVPPGAALALALSALARLHQYQGQLHESLEHGERAMQLAQTLQDEHIVTRCLQHLGVARAQLGQVEHGQSLLKEAARRARQLPCFGCSATSLFHLALLHIPLGAYDQALSLFDEADSMGREGGLGLVHSMQSSYRGLIHLERGRPELAAAQFQAVLADTAAATVTRLHAAIFQAELGLRAGYAEAACESLEALLAGSQPLGAAALRLGLPVLARARHATGDLAGALEQLDRLMAFEQARAPSLDGAAALCETVETLLAAGRPETLAFVLKVLAQVADATGGAVPAAWQHEAQGLQAQHSGQAAQAAGHYRACIEVWRGAGLPFREGRARRRLAVALLSGSRADRNQARQELAFARSLLEQAGARSELNGIARLEGEHGLYAPGPERELLTRREREVLGLLTQGLPNRRIATTLGISERTVEVHVTNILAKLEVTSRVQAATYALEHQLTTGPKG